MNPMMNLMSQMMRSGRNPRSMVEQIMGNSALAQNPIGKNILEMAGRGDLSGIEELGRNIAKERGVDFDSEFEKFKGQFGLK